ncbi:MAG TPA: DeoR/GlpR transcriptional regulator [Devosia sp.]|nr:DeoR/GlpR transcriptional regulator [Devosia sp.]
MVKVEQEQKRREGGKTHRALELLETLQRLGGSARTSHLADTMKVSEETIRRTVKKLSREGRVSRVHGGVYLGSDLALTALHKRIGERADAKRAIAERTASLIDDGATLFMDTGSTSVFVAEALRHTHNLTIVTNSMTVAQTLMTRKGNRVFLAGGELQGQTGGTFGTPTQKYAAKFRADFAILSARAIDPEEGFLVSEQSQAELAQVYVRQARRTIMAVDHSKLDQSAPMVSCAPNEVDYLVCDRPLPEKFARAMERWKVKVLVATEKKKKGK